MNSKSQLNICNWLSPNNRQPLFPLEGELLPHQDWHPNEQKSPEVERSTKITLCGLGFSPRGGQFHFIPQAFTEFMLYTAQCVGSAAGDSTTSPAFHPCKSLLGDSKRRAATVTFTPCLTKKSHRETKCKIKHAQTILTTRLGNKVSPQTPPQIQANGQNHKSHKTCIIGIC